MSFSSMFFLFVFLPGSLLVYYVVPKRFRTVPLVAVSLLFYAWGTPEYLVLMVFSIFFNYITGLELSWLRASERPTAARVTMILAVAVNLLLLGFFKYYGFLVESFNALTGLSLTAPKLALPLGLSFYTFSALSYVLDVYRGKTEAQKNILRFSVYMTFFPKLISGPIVQYADMERQLTERTMAPAKFGEGVNLFLVGLFKKVLLSDQLGAAFAGLSGLPALSAGSAWLGMFLYSLQLYFDFSGYSDMAIGMARMFGFQFEKNFDHPYLSASVSEFWRRWHISLGAWFREYVYIPLGGNRCSTRRQALNLAVVWLLTGLWHGASWTFILWGVYHGAFIMLERFLLKNRLERVPKALRICATALIACFGWVLFFSPDLGSAIHWFAQMFGSSHLGFADDAFRYYLRSNGVLLAVAVLCCGPLLQRLHQRLAYWRGGALTYLSAAAYLLLLVLSVAAMMNATYTSFLYFQF